MDEFDVNKGLELVQKKESSLLFEGLEPTKPVVNEIGSKAEDMVKEATAAAVVHIVTTNSEVKEKLLDHAEETVETVLDTEKRNLKNKQDAAHFDGNKEACRIYGIADTVPQWQQKLMKAWYNALFILYFMIASITIAPINFLAIRMQVAIKQSWIAYVLAVAIFLMVILTPTLLPKLLN